MSRTFRGRPAIREEICQRRLPGRQDTVADLRIDDVVRLGHLRSIEAEQIVLDKGTVPAAPDTLYIDCSASALVIPPSLPVFDGDTINLFMVRTCQPLFSAALIAYVEAHETDPAHKNALCTVVPSPELPIDWLRMWAVSLDNAARWRQNASLQAWMMQCRLNVTAVYVRELKPDDTARTALLRQMGHKAKAATASLPALLESVAA